MRCHRYVYNKIFKYPARLHQRSLDLPSIASKARKQWIHERCDGPIDARAVLLEISRALGRAVTVLRYALHETTLDRCVDSLFEYLMLTKIQFLLTFATQLGLTPFPDKINNFEDARENIDKILYFYTKQKNSKISRLSYHNFVENYILLKCYESSSIIFVFIYIQNICFYFYF